MNILDNASEIKKIDKSNIFASARLLSDQLKQSWEEVKQLENLSGLSKGENIVISGMGGSALGARVADALFTGKMRVPVEIFNDYDLPNYVDKRSLVIISSYSGNTEESISSYNQAHQRGALVFAATTGGKLKEVCEADHTPFYLINPKFNPCQQPRMGIGYSIGTLLSLLQSLNYLNFSQNEYEKALNVMADMIESYDIDNPEIHNLSKRMAHKLKFKIPVLISSSHLMGASHVFKNHLNEEAKTFSCLFDIPEANHHLMEGLMFPKKAMQEMIFLFVQSNNFPDRITKRFKVTKQVVEKNGVETACYTTGSDTKLSQVMEVISFGIFTSLYLSILNNTDPTPIPWVDYFKLKMEK